MPKLTELPYAESVDGSTYLLGVQAGEAIRFSASLLQGADGTDGTTWHFNSGAPVPSLGDDWDVCLDTLTYDIYQKVSGTWSKIGNVKGSDGISPKEIFYAVSGSLQVKTGQLKRHINETHTISSIKILLGSAPAGGSIKLDIRKNGVSHSILESDIEIADGISSLAVTDIPSPSLAANDYLTVDIKQIGTNAAGADLSLVLLLE